MASGQVPKTLLIVDDEADIREILKDTLEPLCTKISLAENGAVALDTVMKGLRPDAILSDISMPAMSGLQLLTELNTLGIICPFIFISGYGNVETVNQTSELGSYGFLDKPFEMQSLKDMVSSALNLGARLKEIEFEMLKFNGSNRSSNQFRQLEAEYQTLLKTKYQAPAKKVS